MKKSNTKQSFNINGGVPQQAPPAHDSGNKWGLGSWIRGIGSYLRPADASDSSSRSYGDPPTHRLSDFPPMTFSAHQESRVAVLRNEAVGASDRPRLASGGLFSPTPPVTPDRPRGSGGVMSRSVKHSVPNSPQILPRFRKLSSPASTAAGLPDPTSRLHAPDGPPSTAGLAGLSLYPAQAQYRGVGVMPSVRLAEREHPALTETNSAMLRRSVTVRIAPPDPLIHRGHFAPTDSLAHRTTSGGAPHDPLLSALHRPTSAFLSPSVPSDRTSVRRSASMVDTTRVVTALREKRKRLHNDDEASASSSESDQANKRTRADDESSISTTQQPLVPFITIPSSAASSIADPAGRQSVADPAGRQLVADPVRNLKRPTLHDDSSDSMDCDTAAKRLRQYASPPPPGIDTTPMTGREAWGVGDQRVRGGVRNLVDVSYVSSRRWLSRLSQEGVSSTASREGSVLETSSEAGGGMLLLGRHSLAADPSSAGNSRRSSFSSHLLAALNTSEMQGGVGSFKSSAPPSGRNTPCSSLVGGEEGGVRTPLRRRSLLHRTDGATRLHPAPLGGAVAHTGSPASSSINDSVLRLSQAGRGALSVGDLGRDRSAAMSVAQRMITELDGDVNDNNLKATPTTSIASTVTPTLSIGSSVGLLPLLPAVAFSGAPLSSLPLGAPLIASSASLLSSVPAAVTTVVAGTSITMPATQLVVPVALTPVPFDNAAPADSLAPPPSAGFAITAPTTSTSASIGGGFTFSAPPAISAISASATGPVQSLSSGLVASSTAPASTTMGVVLGSMATVTFSAPGGFTFAPSNPTNVASPAPAALAGDFSFGAAQAATNHSRVASGFTLGSTGVAGTPATQVTNAPNIGGFKFGTVGTSGGASVVPAVTATTPSAQGVLGASAVSGVQPALNPFGAQASAQSASAVSGCLATTSAASFLPVFGSVPVSSFGGFNGSSQTHAAGQNAGSTTKPAALNIFGAKPSVMSVPAYVAVQPSQVSLSFGVAPSNGPATLTYAPSFVVKSTEDAAPAQQSSLFAFGATGATPQSSFGSFSQKPAAAAAAQPFTFGQVAASNPPVGVGMFAGVAAQPMFSAPAQQPSLGLFGGAAQSSSMFGTQQTSAPSVEFGKPFAPLAPANAFAGNNGAPSAANGLFGVSAAQHAGAGLFGGGSAGLSASQGFNFGASSQPGPAFQFGASQGGGLNSAVNFGTPKPVALFGLSNGSVADVAGMGSSPQNLFAIGRITADRSASQIKPARRRTVKK